MKIRPVQVLGFKTLLCWLLLFATANATFLIEELPNKQDISELVIKLAAEQFGVDESDINLATHLSQDLLADQMDVYHLVSLASDTYSREIGQVGQITTIEDVVNHVLNAPLQALDITSRGNNQETGSNGASIKRIYFATDREFKESKNPNEIFNGERSSNELKLSYGYCDVSIPDSHKPGQLELPLLDLLSNPKHHFELHAVELLEWESFLNSIRQTFSDIETEGKNDVLLFIHGYKVRFENAAIRTAQVAVDLGFAGVPILYSWPSDGRLSSYFSDREDAEWSAAHLDEFLINIVENPDFGKVHLIAHSMGSQALLRALHRISLRGKVKEPVFENVILAAPDFDAQTFIDQMAVDVRGIARNWTLYTSHKDMALYASRLIRQTLSIRLGEPLPLLSGIDTVDASNIEVSPWSLPENHSYYATKQRVINDLKGLLAGDNPEMRGLISEISEKGKYWRIFSQ